MSTDGGAFTTDPDAVGKTPYRLVVLFDPAPSVNPDKLCEVSPEATSAASVPGEAGRVHMLVSYCNGDRSSASVIGWAPAASPEADAFKSLLQQASLELFSNRTIERRSNGADFIR